MSPLEWGGVSRADTRSPNEWGSGATVALNATAALEWLDVARVDATVPSEGLAGTAAPTSLSGETSGSPRGDAQAPLEPGGLARGDVSAPLEAVLGEQLDVPVASEFLLSMPIELDASAPIMWGGIARLDATVALEMTGMVRGPDTVLPIEIAAGSSVIANTNAPAEWLTTAYSDAPMTLEAQLATRADLSVPIEDLGSGHADDVLPGESASGALREDTIAPLEATANSYSDDTMPIEMSGVFYADIPLQFVWTITGYGDWLVGGESQQEVARGDDITWLEYTSLSNIMVVNADTFAPLAWEALSLADVAVPAESTDGVQGDAGVLLSYQIAAQQDLPIALESTGNMRLDVVVNYQIRLGVHADTSLAAEWQGAIDADRTVPGEYVRGQQRDAVVSAESLYAQH
jgi:hypothetical protein